MHRCEPSLIASLLLAPVLALVGCTLNPSRADVVGSYELRGIKAGRITLSLREDGFYSEDIVWPSRREAHSSGIWTLSGGNVDLSALWIPREFAPDYILDADGQTSPPMPKYTEPGHWDLTGEKRWGVVFLGVFPDADVEFKKIRGT